MKNKQYLHFIYICDVLLPGQFLTFLKKYRRYCNINHHQNLRDYFLFQHLAVQKISCKFIHNYLRNPVHRQTDKLTNQGKIHNLLGGGNRVIHTAGNNKHCLISTKSCLVQQSIDNRQKSTINEGSGDWERFINSHTFLSNEIDQRC